MFGTAPRLRACRPPPTRPSTEFRSTIRSSRRPLDQREFRPGWRRSNRPRPVCSMNGLITGPEYRCATRFRRRYEAAQRGAMGGLARGERCSTRSALPPAAARADRVPARRRRLDSHGRAQSRRALWIAGRLSSSPMRDGAEIGRRFAIDRKPPKPGARRRSRRWRRCRGGPIRRCPRRASRLGARIRGRPLGESIARRVEWRNSTASRMKLHSSRFQNTWTCRRRSVASDATPFLRRTFLAVLYGLPTSDDIAARSFQFMPAVHLAGSRPCVLRVNFVAIVAFLDMICRVQSRGIPICVISPGCLVLPRSPSRDLRPGYRGNMPLARRCCWLESLPVWPASG